MSTHYARGKSAQTLRIADAEGKKRRILCNVRANSPQTAFAASTSFASASVISSHRKEMFSDSRLTAENAGRQSGAQQPPRINLRSDSAPSPDSPFPPDDCEPPFCLRERTFRELVLWVQRVPDWLDGFDLLTMSPA